MMKDGLVPLWRYGVRRTILLSLLAGIALGAPGPVLADESKRYQTEIRRLVKRKINGDADAARALPALIAEARKKLGYVPLGIFKGKLQPMLGKIDFDIPPELQYRCKTKVTMTPENPAYAEFIGGSAEEYFVRKIGHHEREIVIRVTYSSDVSESTFVSDGNYHRLDRFAFKTADEEESVVRLANGDYRETNSGEILTPGAEFNNAMKPFLEGITFQNPFWFASNFQLEVGDPFLPKTSKKTFENISNLLNTIILEEPGHTEAPASLNIEFVESMVTGYALIDGDQHIIIEGYAKGRLTQSGKNSPVVMLMSLAFNLRNFVPTQTFMRSDTGTRSNYARMDVTSRCEDAS